MIIAPEQENNPVSILSDEFCEEQALPYVVPKGKFGCKVLQDTPVRPAR